MSVDTLIFFGIIILFGFLFLATLIFIIYKIFQALKNILSKLFEKDEELQDLGADIDIKVKELEESKKERQELEKKRKEFGKTSMGGPKLQYYTSPKASKDEKTAENDQKKIFDEKGEQDIEEGLSALKKSGKESDNSAAKGLSEIREEEKGEQEKQDAFSRIKIPRGKNLSEQMSEEARMLAKLKNKKAKLKTFQIKRKMLQRKNRKKKMILKLTPKITGR